VEFERNVRNHPKVVQAGPLASWLWFAGISYADDYATDGFIPTEAVPTLANFQGCFVPDPAAPTAVVVVDPLQLAERLVRVRLWERVEGGFQVHDFLEHNESRADRERQRTQRADAGRKGGRAKHTANKRLASRQPFASDVALANGKHSPSESPADPLPNTPLIHKRGPAPKNGQNLGSSMNPSKRGFGDEIPQNRLSGEKRRSRSRSSRLTVIQGEWGTPEALAELWNQLAPVEANANGRVILPRVRILTTERRKRCQVLLKEFPEKAWWVATLHKYPQSRFLRGLANGQGHEHFLPDFDWLLARGRDRIENVVKVAEGKYDDDRTDRFAGRHRAALDGLEAWAQQRTEDES